MITIIKEAVADCVRWNKAVLDALEAERVETRRQAGVITAFEAQQGER